MTKHQSIIGILTLPVTVTSSQMCSRPNFDNYGSLYSGICVQSLTYLIFMSPCCDDIIGEVKGSNKLPPPPAAGGWRGGPAAAGPRTWLISSVSWSYHWSKIERAICDIIDMFMHRYVIDVVGVVLNAGVKYTLLQNSVLAKCIMSNIKERM